MQIILVCDDFNFKYNLRTKGWLMINMLRYFEKYSSDAMVYPILASVKWRKEYIDSEWLWRVVVVVVVVVVVGGGGGIKQEWMINVSVIYQILILETWRYSPILQSQRLVPHLNDSKTIVIPQRPKQRRRTWIQNILNFTGYLLTRG